MDISPCLVDGKSHCVSFDSCVVTNFDALEKLLQYGVSSGLHYNASEHPLFIVVDPFFYNEQLFKLAELAFEKLGFPAIYFMKSSSCIGYSLLSSLHAQLLPRQDDLSLRGLRRQRNPRGSRLRRLLPDDVYAFGPAAR